MLLPKMVHGAAPPVRPTQIIAVSEGLIGSVLPVLKKLDNCYSFSEFIPFRKEGRPQFPILGRSP